MYPFFIFKLKQVRPLSVIVLIGKDFVQTYCARSLNYLCDIRIVDGVILLRRQGETGAQEELAVPVDR